MPTPAILFAGLIFGLIGFVAFRYGMRTQRPYPAAIGMLLMVYPYFVEQTWLVYLFGMVLCVVLYLTRHR